MLESVKLALRIKNAAFDEEIQSLIAAALLDLHASGVVLCNPPGELARTAVMLYAKAHFGFSENQERYKEAYREARAKLKWVGDRM